MSDLDSIFNQHAIRTQKQREANEKRQATDKERGENASRILSSVALPVLKELSEDIVKRGHQSEVRERLDSNHPSLEIHFRPRQSDSWKSSARSTLEFSLNQMGKVEIKRTIGNTERDALAGYRSNEEVALADVSESKVRGTVLVFITSALEHA